MKVATAKGYLFPSRVTSIRNGALVIDVVVYGSEALRVLPCPCRLEALIEVVDLD